MLYQQQWAIGLKCLQSCYNKYLGGRVWLSCTFTEKKHREINADTGSIHRRIYIYTETPLTSGPIRVRSITSVLISKHINLITYSLGNVTMLNKDSCSVKVWKLEASLKILFKIECFWLKIFFSNFELSCLDIRFAHLDKKSKRFKSFMSLKHSIKNQIINIVLLFILCFSFVSCSSFDAIIWPVRPVSMSACTRRILRIGAFSCLATSLYR